MGLTVSQPRRGSFSQRRMRTQTGQPRQSEPSTWTSPHIPQRRSGGVYQSFLDYLEFEGIKPSTIHRYRYNIVRFEKWLVAEGRPATLASLEHTTRIAYKQHLEILPQQPKGSIRRRRGVSTDKRRRQDIRERSYG